MSIKIHDYIVVGSGCSGAIAAQTLVEAGANVTMLDVGVAKDKTLKMPDKDFVSLRRTDQNQYRYFIGKNAEGVNWGKVGTGAQITPPRKYILNLVDRFAPVESSTFSSFESLGYGGMGIGWGLQVWEYTKADMAAVGLDFLKMTEAYKYIAKRVGVSASNNDATKLAVNNLDYYQPAPKMDRNNSVLYKKYLLFRKSLNKRGVVIGQTPLTLLTKDLGSRKKYNYKGMDFYADSGKSGWRPWMTVDQLKNKRNFTYINGYLVLKFVEKKDITEVHCLHIDTEKTKIFLCRKLILGAGTLGSARIVLRSFNKKGVKLPILSNPYTYIPCIQPSMIGKGPEPKKLAFAQLSLFLNKAKLQETASMASFHSYQSLMLFRIITQIPFNFIDARKIMRYLSTGIVIVGVYHPDAPSKNKYIQLVPDSASPTGDKLKIEYSLQAGEEREYKKREKKIMKALRKLRAYPIKRIYPGAGSGIHYGGTLPFSDDERPYTLSPSGRLHMTKSVYVADSSGFKYLPAQHLTFSILANAHEVAKEAMKVKSNKSTSHKPTVVITGASGFLGSALVESFKNDGWQVTALVRNAHSLQTPGVKYVEYDLTKPFDANMFAGADYLVHAAYEKYDKKHPDALRTNLKAAERLLKASRQHKLKRNIFISSMSAHDGAESVYGKQKLAVEKLFKDKDCTVIRSGLIMGNGGMVGQMTSFMKSKHAVPLIGGGKQPLQVIAIYDLVRVIKAILEQNKAGMLTIATPEVYTYKEFYTVLRKSLGITVAFIPIPYGFLFNTVKFVNALHLPISLNQDNLLGLKHLRAANTSDDLKALDIKIDNLEKILKNSELLKNF